jgi:hypothetical protein
MGKRKAVEVDEDLPDDPRPPFYTWQDCLVAIDIFGYNPALEIRGKRKQKSCWGAFNSFIVILLVFIYSTYKVLVYLQQIPGV